MKRKREAHVEAAVCFVSDPTIIDRLTPHLAEVDEIFTHPLRGCLDAKVDGEDAARLSAKGGEWWPFPEDFHVSFQLVGSEPGNADHAVHRRQDRSYRRISYACESYHAPAETGD